MSGIYGLHDHPGSWIGNGRDHLELFESSQHVLIHLSYLYLPEFIWVQPISLLDPVVEDLLVGQRVIPPPPAGVDGEEEY